MFGKLASDLTVSRLITLLAADPSAALTARSIPCAGPFGGGERHSDLQTWLRISPLLAFVDHGTDGTGELVAALLRPGNAGSNTAHDHIAVTRKALAQLSSVHRARPVRMVLVRTDDAGYSHRLLTWLHKRGMSYSIGGLTDAMVAAIETERRGLHARRHRQCRTDLNPAPRLGSTVRRGLHDTQGFDHTTTDGVGDLVIISTAIRAALRTVWQSWIPPSWCAVLTRILGPAGHWIIATRLRRSLVRQWRSGTPSAYWRLSSRHLRVQIRANRSPPTAPSTRWTPATPMRFSSSITSCP